MLGMTVLFILYAKSWMRVMVGHAHTAVQVQSKTKARQSLTKRVKWQKTCFITHLFKKELLK